MKFDIDNYNQIVRIDWGQYDSEKNGHFDVLEWSLMFNSNKEEFEDDDCYCGGGVEGYNPKYYYVKENEKKYYIVISDKRFTIYKYNSDGYLDMYRGTYYCVMMCYYKGDRYIKMLDKNRFLL